MCGIAGELRYDGTCPDLARVQAMARKMAPRGPDAFGSFAQNALAVVHRRLRVMDGSERSQQPMVDPDLGLWIVFNGAIYNHPELRRELEGYGYRFWSRGDTEVLLRLLERDGERALEHLRGMFAFAFYDFRQRRLLLARDHLGGIGDRRSPLEAGASGRPARVAIARSGVRGGRRRA